MDTPPWETSRMRVWVGRGFVWSSLPHPAGAPKSEAAGRGPFPPRLCPPPFGAASPSLCPLTAHTLIPEPLQHTRNTLSAVRILQKKVGVVLIHSHQTATAVVIVSLPGTEGKRGQCPRLGSRAWRVADVPAAWQVNGSPPGRGGTWRLSTSVWPVFNPPCRCVHPIGTLVIALHKEAGQLPSWHIRVPGGVHPNSTETEAPAPPGRQPGRPCPRSFPCCPLYDTSVTLGEALTELWGGTQ